MIIPLSDRTRHLVFPKVLVTFSDFHVIDDLSRFDIYSIALFVSDRIINARIIYASIGTSA